jgi:hypothetical protein
VSVQALYLNEDNLIRWDRARLASDSSYVNAGTAAWVLKDDAEAVRDSGTLDYVAGSSGRWQGTLDRTITALLVEGASYHLEITLATGAGADGFRRIELVAQYHEGS